MRAWRRRGPAFLYLVLAFFVLAAPHHCSVGEEGDIDAAYLQDYRRVWAATAYASLVPDARNTLTIKVPAGATTPLKPLGARMSTAAAWTGTVYIDSFDWSGA